MSDRVELLSDGNVTFTIVAIDSGASSGIGRDSYAIRAVGKQGVVLKEVGAWTGVEARRYRLEFLRVDRIQPELSSASDARKRIERRVRLKGPTGPLSKDVWPCEPRLSIRMLQRAVRTRCPAVTSGVVSRLRIPKDQVPP